jgi:O-antigen ligase
VDDQAIAVIKRSVVPGAKTGSSASGLPEDRAAWALAAALAGVVTTLAVAEGGYFANAWGWAALALAAITALGLLTLDPNVTRLEVVAVAALVAFAAWSLFSAIWSIDAFLTLREAERVLVYIAGLAAALAVTRRRRIAPLLGSLAAAISVVSLGALLDYVFRDEVDPVQGRLLFEPLGYANALGIFAAIGILLAVGFAAQEDRLRRLLALAALPLLVPVLALTSSRGASAALAVGLATTVALDPRRRRLIPVGRRGAVAAFATVLVAAAVLLALHPDRSLGVIGDRPDQWRVAWRAFANNPWLGTGAGTFRDYWLEERPIRTDVLDAHSLYLETLGEVGAVGFALLLVALALPAVAAVRARSEPLVPAAAGAYVTFLVHCAIDWNWEIPAVTLAALLCGAALLRACDGRRSGDRRRAIGAGLAAGATLAGLAVLTILETAGPL